MRFALASIAILLASLSLPAQADGTHDFAVVNLGPEPMVHLFISRTNDDGWGPDLLRAPLVAKSSQPVAIPGDPRTNPKSCPRDIRAVFDDGQYVTVKQYDTCTNHLIAIHGG